jgi:hypothetical protein
MVPRGGDHFLSYFSILAGRVAQNHLKQAQGAPGRLSHPEVC